MNDTELLQDFSSRLLTLKEFDRPEIYDRLHQVFDNLDMLLLEDFLENG